MESLPGTGQCLFSLDHSGGDSHAHTSVLFWTEKPGLHMVAQWERRPLPQHDERPINKMACIRLIMEATLVFHHTLVYAFPLRSTLIRMGCQSRFRGQLAKPTHTIVRSRTVVICWNKGSHPHVSSSSRLLHCKSYPTGGNADGESCASLVFS